MGWDDEDYYSVGSGSGSSDWGSDSDIGPNDPNRLFSTEDYWRKLEDPNGPVDKWGYRTDMPDPVWLSRPSSPIYDNDGNYLGMTGGAGGPSGNYNGLYYWGSNNSQGGFSTPNTGYGPSKASQPSTGGGSPIPGASGTGVPKSSLPMNTPQPRMVAEGGMQQIPGPPELNLESPPAFTYNIPTEPAYNTSIPNFSYTPPGYSGPAPQQGPTTYTSTPQTAIPTFTGPEYDKTQANKYATQFAMPYVGEIRRAIRDAIVRTGSSTSPIQRRYQLGDIINTSAEGLGKVMGQATQAGMAQYNTEHARLLDAAKVDYSAKVNAINQSNATQAEKDARQFAAERDYIAQKNSIDAQKYSQIYGAEAQTGYNTALTNFQAQQNAINQENERKRQTYLTQLQTGYNTAQTNYNAQLQGIMTENQAMQQRNNQMYQAALAAMKG